MSKFLYRDTKYKETDSAKIALELVYRCEAAYVALMEASVPGWKPQKK